MRTARGVALLVASALALLTPATAGAQQTPKKTETQRAAEKYRVLTEDDGLSCAFSQDLSISMGGGFSGSIGATKDHFKCVDKAKKEVEIELKSVGAANGKVAIRTTKFGTVYRGNEPGTFGTYEMTDRQIKELKTFLGL